LENEHCDYLPEFEKIIRAIEEKHNTIEMKKDFNNWIIATKEDEIPTDCGTSIIEFESAI